MNTDGFFRFQKWLQSGIFICLLIAFFSWLYPGIRLYFVSPDVLFSSKELLENAELFWAVARYASIVALLLFFFNESVVFLIDKSILPLNDERTRMNKLQSYKAAFVVVLFIQIVSRSLMIIFNTNLRGQSWITVTAGFLVLTGVRVYHSFENENES